VNAYETLVLLGTPELRVKDRLVSWPAASAVDGNIIGVNHDTNKIKAVKSKTAPRTGFLIYKKTSDNLFSLLTTLYC
jgi:hypothetical protein